jgi:hypothetical protein
VVVEDWLIELVPFSAGTVRFDRATVRGAQITLRPSSGPEGFPAGASGETRATPTIGGRPVSDQAPSRTASAQPDSADRVKFRPGFRTVTVSTG